MRIIVEVAESARLSLVMPPTVICAGARHSVDTRAGVAADGELLLREETVLGRSGEQGGEVTLRTRLDVAAIPVLRQTIPLRGTADGPWSPRAVGALLHISPAQKRPAIDDSGASGARAAWLTLPREAGHQLTAVADDALALSLLLDGAQRQLPRYVV
jgi:urease accessory protein